MSTRVVTYGLSEDDIYNDIITILETCFEGEIVRGNQEIPLPTSSADFIIVTLVTSKALSQAVNRYKRQINNGINFVTKTSINTFQLDVYGKNAMQIKDALLFYLTSQESYQFQKINTPRIRVASIKERGRMPVINDQRRYENRYVLDVDFNIFNEVGKHIDFVDATNVKPIRIY